MKKQLQKIFFILTFMFLVIFGFSVKVNAEGTKDMYDWENYSTANGQNDRWFFYYNDQNSETAGVKNDTVIKVYAKEGETIKFATSGTGFKITKPGETTPSTVSVTQTNGAVGFIANANQEKNKTYTYVRMVADRTGVYTFKALQRSEVRTANVNGSLGIRNINSGDTNFTTFQTVAYIAAWDVQVEDANGQDINGRIWMDYVSVYRGYSSYNNYSRGNVRFHILTDDGYNYDMNCKGMDPGGMNFFIGTRGLIDKNTNQILYKSVPQSSVGSSVLMPVPSNGNTEFDSYGKIFFNSPANDLPLSIKREKTETKILENLTFNEEENRGEAKLAGTFSFSLSDPCMYTIKIKNKNTGAVLRTLNSSGVSGKNSIIWDGKADNGSYVDPGEYSATLELRNGEYHFILIDVETIYEGITIKSEENGNATLYYDNSSISGPNASVNGINSETTPFNYGFEFGDVKMINLWTYNSVQSTTDFFVMDAYQGTKCVLKGRVFFDENNSKSYDAKDKPLAGIKMKITNLTTNDVYMTETVTNGEFFANVLKNANYKVEVAEESKNTKLVGYTNTTNNDVQTKNVTGDTSFADIGYYVQLKEFTIDKIWDDFDNENGFRPDTITVKILNGTKEVERCLVKASLGWNATVRLPKFENGQEVSYSIEECEISDFYKIENAVITKTGDNYTIKNVLEIPDDKIIVEINKVWDDNNNEFRLRPESITGTVISSLNTSRTFTLNQTDGWTTKLLLDKYDSNGRLITYRVEEDAIDQYTYNIENEDNVFTITNSLVERANITVNKVWDDQNTTDRPEYITIRLFDGENEVDTKTISAEDNWSCVFNTMPKYRNDGSLIEYTVKEDEVFGYELVSNDYVDENTIQLVNKWFANISITIKKSWEDSDDKLQIRPDSILVDIVNKNTGEIVKKNIRISSSDSWAYIVRGLRKYDENDEEIEYEVKEKLVDNYVLVSGAENNVEDTATENKKVCNLTNSLNSVKIQLNKVWDDENDQRGKRPEEIEVSVFANGKFLEKVYIKKSENWEKVIGPYSRYDENDEEIEYTVKESDVDLYVLKSIEEQEVSGVADVVFSGMERWHRRDDGTYESTSQNQHSTTALLTSDYFTLNVDGNLEFDWTVSSESISYDYIYYVVKDTNNSVVTGGTGTKIGGTSYGSVYESLNFMHTTLNLNAGTYKIEFYYIKDGSANNGLDQGFVKNVKYTSEANVSVLYRIENKLEIPDEKINLTIEKVWDDNNNEAGKRPDEIKVNLYSDDTLKEAIILKSAEDWKTTINDLPIYDSNGNKINYTVKELNTNSLFYSLDNSVISGIENNKITITNKYERPQEKVEVDIKKEWDDNNNSAGKRPDSITANLYGNDVLVKSVELNQANNWYYEFNDLYKYDEEGNEIIYTVDENSISMYKLTGNEKSKKLVITNLEMDVDANTKWSKKSDGTWESKINGQSSQSAVLKSKPFTLVENLSLKFDWSVSSESASYDYLNYTIRNSNGAVVYNGENIGGINYGTSYETLNFMHKEIPLQAGTYTIEFCYRKDGSVDNGLDQGFVRNICYMMESDNGSTYTLTNKYEPVDDTFNLTVNKEWNDNNNENGRRPDSIEIGLYENGNKRNVYTLNESEGWTKTISNLAKKYPSGEDIVYTVKEEKTNSSFYKLENAEISEIENNTITITNNFELPLETMNLKIEKKWDDNENSAGKRPEEVTFAISANTEIIGQYTLTAEENWEKTIENLRVYDDDGNKIVYKAEEVDINSIFYRLVSYEENGNTIILTNTFELPDVQTFLKVENKWDDNENRAKKRPVTHRVELYANDVPTGEKYDLNENESWVYTFSNLDKYDENGDEIEYSVRENTPANYNLVSNVRMGDTITITNRYRSNLQTISVSVQKIWDDNNNEAEKRPASINIQLLADGEVETEHELTADEGWAYTFEDVYKYNYDNEEILYTVVENPVDANYMVSNVNSTDRENLKVVELTNTFNPNEEKKSITVNKVWDDNDNSANKRPEEIMVNLKLGTSILNTKKLNETNNWSTVFEELSKFDTLNNELEYNIEEVCDSELYSQTDYQNENDTVTITNTFAIPDEKINIEATKMWTDKNNLNNERPDSITFVLKSNNQEIARQEVSGDKNSNDGWKYTFTDLPKYDSNGDIIVYSIDEEVQSDLYVKEVNGFTVVNTYKLNNSVIKNNNIKKTGTKFIENKDEKVDYKLEYNATIEEFFGNAKIIITDKLPYSINESESELAGGIYNSNSKTITWVENIDNIDTYTNGAKTVEIEKELSLKYVGIKDDDTIIKNYVEANTKLEKANVESIVDDEWDTDIKATTQEEKTEPKIEIEEKGGEVEEQTTEPVEKEVKFEVQYEAKAEIETKTQVKKTKNPPTGDNIKSYLIMFEIALIVFNSIKFIKKKNK